MDGARRAAGRKKPKSQVKQFDALRKNNPEVWKKKMLEAIARNPPGEDRQHPDWAKVMQGVSQISEAKSGVKMKRIAYSTRKSKK